MGFSRELISNYISLFLVGADNKTSCLFGFVGPVLIGCDINIVDLGIKISERMECVWSKRHLVCVCVYQHGYSGFMAIAPDQVCLGHAVKSTCNNLSAKCVIDQKGLNND